MQKIIRAATVAGSVRTFCRGLLSELSDDYEVVVVASDDGQLHDIAADEHVRCVAVDMQRRIAPLADLRSLWHLVRVFRRERPAMVHSMTPKAGLLCMTAAWMCRVPVRVHTFTGLVFPTASGLKRQLLMLTDRLTCACATHIIPEGEGVKNDLQHYGITAKEMHVLGHGNVRGIDLGHYDRTPEVMARARQLRDDSTLTYIFVGRITCEKGVRELVSAFTALHRQRPHTRLVLVGRTEPDIDPLPDDTLRQISGNPGILAVGQLDDVRPWLAAADIFVLPSYREGVPNCVIEAGAMSLPSIVTDINGSREIILDGRNGLIVPSRSADALSQAMLTLCDNSDTRDALAANARELVASRYEQGYVRQCLRDFYRQVLPTD